MRKHPRAELFLLQTALVTMLRHRYRRSRSMTEAIFETNDANVAVIAAPRTMFARRTIAFFTQRRKRFYFTFDFPLEYFIDIGYFIRFLSHYFLPLQHNNNYATLQGVVKTLLSCPARNCISAERDKESRGERYSRSFREDGISPRLTPSLQRVKMRYRNLRTARSARRNT